jgi:hypothetical protein
MAECYQKAGEACPNGYTILDESESTRPSAVSQVAASVCLGQKAADPDVVCDTTVQQVTVTTVLVECGAADDSVHPDNEADRGFFPEPPMAERGFAPPAEPAPPAEESGPVGEEPAFECDLDDRRSMRRYHLTFVASECGRIGSSETIVDAWPPSADHSMPDGIRCSVGADVVSPDSCRRDTVWACTAPNMITLGFGTELRQNASGGTDGTMQIMDPSGCTNTYRVQSF